jgi:hypothetical protein
MQLTGSGGIGSRLSDHHRGVPHREAAPNASIAAPMPASSSSSLAGGNWLASSLVGSWSSHSARV